MELGFRVELALERAARMVIVLFILSERVLF